MLGSDPWLQLAGCQSCHSGCFRMWLVAGNPLCWALVLYQEAEYTPDKVTYQTHAPGINGERVSSMVQSKRGIAHLKDILQGPRL